ncbi:MAG: hypothetical protein M0005_04685 [Actinomycetota bacterium]|nr:hypothetical protein [Actinomycetota bacterium]
MLRLVRPVLMAVVLVLAGLWLFGTVRSLLSSVGFYLFLALVAVLFVRRGRRRVT